MQKTVLLTDTHLGLKNDNQYWIDITEKLFNEVIDYCLRNGIKQVIHLGDFFDSRKSLNVLTMSKAIEICKLFEKNKIALYLILGNHDQFYKKLPYPNSLSYLNLFEYTHVIDKEPYYLDDNNILVPWSYDISSLPENTNLFGHFEINGFVTNSSGNTQENSTLNISDFEKFNNVYSGHFHTPSVNNNIQYIGSAFAMTFNDVDSQRGYYDIDKNFLMKFIEYTSAPKFKIITSEDEFKKEEIESNIIRFTFVKDYGNIENEKIMQSIYELNPSGVFIDYQIQMEDEDLVLDNENFEVNDNSVVMDDYINNTKNIPEYIDKKVLKQFKEKLEKE